MAEKQQKTWEHIGPGLSAGLSPPYPPGTWVYLRRSVHEGNCVVDLPRALFIATDTRCLVNVETGESWPIDTTMFSGADFGLVPIPLLGSR